jgi:hypothetical protein
MTFFRALQKDTAESPVYFGFFGQNKIAQKRCNKKSQTLLLGI